MSRYMRRRARRRAVWAVIALMACAYMAGAALSLPGREAESPAKAEYATRTMALDEYKFYAIQFGAFDREADARALSAAYTSRGAAGYVLADTRYRAIGAAYTSHSDALSVQQNLEAQGIESYIYEVSAPDIALRVTAEAELLDALEAALPISAQAIAELGEQALMLDRGETSVQDARAAMDAIAQPALKAAAQLDKLLAGRTHALSAGLLSQLNAVCDSCAALGQLSSESSVDFSGKIKYNVIDLMQRHVKFMHLLIQPAASA